jgi:osmoprotectant transport system permease protein
MGMSFWQILFRIEIPLALPTLFAGIRTATVINVGIATLAAYIAAGGLGEFIFGGIALNNSTMIIAGALPAALLAIVLDFLLSKIQHLSRTNKNKALIAMPLVILLLATLSAFSPSKQTRLLAGFAPEFTGRQDGLPALKEAYDLKISNVVIGPALMYKAIHENYVDVISGYSTDGRIKSYDLFVLEDDLNSFPPYQAGLLVHQNVFSRYPNLDVVLNKLSGRINDSLMTQLNFLVDDQKLPVQDVARQFLESQDLLEPTPTTFEGELNMGSKIFTEQYILTEIYKQLIEGHAGIKVNTKNGLGGTKICFDALVHKEIDMYPEYSGTALQVLLNAQQEGRSSPEIYAWVSEQLTKQHQLVFSEALGFNNTYALMMRKEQADKLGVKSISELVHYLEDH